MSELNDLKLFIIQHQAWAGLILGLAAFGESLVFVGLFIPATALMIVTGTLIAHHALNPTTVFLCSVTGAVAGDATSYWIGRWIGPSVSRRWPFNRDKSAVALARLFFRRYGFLSIFLGRFLGPVRSTVPLVAGMTRMSQLMFQIANVTSALAWVPFMLALGYFPAKRIHDLGDIKPFQLLWILGGIVFLTLAFTAVGFYFQWRRHRQRLQRRALLRSPQSVPG